MTRCCCFHDVFLGVCYWRWSFNGGRYVAVEGTYVLSGTAVLSALGFDDIASWFGCR